MGHDPLVGGKLTFGGTGTGWHSEVLLGRGNHESAKIKLQCLK